MSSWSYALTNKGRQLQAKAQAGAQLVYTRMAVGSGTLSGQSLESMTALIAPVKDLDITRLKRPAGATRALIGATLTNQDVTTGFYLREVGIFADDPDDGEILYMYANSGATADYITPQGDGVIEKAINMNVFVGAAADITANIDESLVYVTQEELADAIAGIQINDATTTQKGIVQLSNATNSTAEDRAATPKAVKSAYDAAVAAQTTANAANEAASQAFQLGNERKQEVVDILIAKGISASTSESWESLLSKMTGIIKATGNATAADVLSGKTFSNASGNNLTGAMTNRGAVNQTITTQGGQYTIPAGYHNGSGKVTASFANLLAGNIKKGVNIGGVVGALQAGVVSDVTYVNTVSGSGNNFNQKLAVTLPAGVDKALFLSHGISVSTSYGNVGTFSYLTSDRVNFMSRLSIGDQNGNLVPLTIAENGVARILYVLIDRTAQTVNIAYYTEYYNSTNASFNNESKSIATLTGDTLSFRFGYGTYNGVSGSGDVSLRGALFCV